ncbi:hypothetical protein Droror1_Dr00008678 [Drosera rotundifolia]
MYSEFCSIMGTSSPHQISDQIHTKQENPILHENKNEKPKSEIETILRQSCTATPESSAGVVVLDEENDGFQTPTSSRHRIPEIRPCPPRPSPRRVQEARRWRRTKRGCCDNRRSDHRVLLDVSKEVESMFPDIVRANFGQKIKRARSH